MIRVTNAGEFPERDNFCRGILNVANFLQRHLRPLKPKARRLAIQQLIDHYDAVIVVVAAASVGDRLRYTFHAIKGRQTLWLDHIGVHLQPYTVAAIWADDDNEVEALRQLAGEVSASQ
jgi:hypothetical protein